MCSSRMLTTPLLLTILFPQRELVSGVVLPCLLHPTSCLIRGTERAPKQVREGKREHNGSSEFQHAGEGGRGLFLKVRGQIYFFPWEVTMKFY